MFDCCLFREEYDLLEVVESELEQNKIINTFISESDMMISLYENQRLLIEEDTNIFMKLNYEFVNENALDTIVEVIKNILRRIKELIVKFFNFITGKKNKTENKDTKDIDIKDIDKNVEKTEKKIKEVQTKNSDNTEILQKLDQYEKTLEEYKNEYNNTEFHAITIDEKLFKSINYNDTWEELDKTLDIVYSIIDAIKDEVGSVSDTIETGLEKIKDFRAKDKFTPSEIDSMITYNGKCYTKEYFENYHEPLKVFFKDYSSKTSDVIKDLQSIYKKRIEPLDKIISKLEKQYKKSSTSYKKYIRNLHDCIAFISMTCTMRIKLLINIQNAYNMYNTNNVMIGKLELINEKIESVNSEIDNIKKQK